MLRPVVIHEGDGGAPAQAEDLERMESDFRNKEQASWLEQHFQLSSLIDNLSSLTNAVRSSDTGMPEPRVRTQ